MQSKHETIAGAVLDFLGYLYSREETLLVGKDQEVDRLVDLFKLWAKARGLQTQNPDAEGWEKILEQ